MSDMKSIVNSPISQYDIWFADLKGEENSCVQYGKRPVLIVSNDIANRYSPVVTIVPLTSKQKKKYLPTHVKLFPVGLLYPSTALCEQIQTIDKARLSNKLTSLTDKADIKAVTYAVSAQLMPLSN